MAAHGTAAPAQALWLSAFTVAAAYMLADSGMCWRAEHRRVPGTATSIPTGRQRSSAMRRRAPPPLQPVSPKDAGTHSLIRTIPLESWPLHSRKCKVLRPQEDSERLQLARSPCPSICCFKLCCVVHRRLNSGAKATRGSCMTAYSITETAAAGPWQKITLASANVAPPPSPDSPAVPAPRSHKCACEGTAAGSSMRQPVPTRVVPLRQQHAPASWRAGVGRPTSIEE